MATETQMNRPGPLKPEGSWSNVFSYHTMDIEVAKSEGIYFSLCMGDVHSFRHEPISFDHYGSNLPPGGSSGCRTVTAEGAPDQAP